jgi:hypothetical protein
MKSRILIISAIVLVIALTTSIIGTTLTQIQTTYASRAGGEVVSSDVRDGTSNTIVTGGAAPLAISGDSIYVTWWTNKTGNDEVMFRVSTDGGKTFGDKINLSNSPNSNSVNVQIAEDEGKVAVSWWEQNATSNEPVMRLSTDNGKTFGDIIHLSANGKIG